MRATRAMAAVVTLALGAGCAARKPELLGRTLSVARSDGGKRVEGELIAVQDGALLLRRADGLQQVPLAAVLDVKIKRHAWGGSRGLKWSLLAGVVTGAGLAASCSSVSSGCGSVGAAVLATWLVVGGLSSLSMEASSQLRVASPSEEALRPYARFPQGLPAGLHDAALVPPGLQRRDGGPGAAAPPSIERR
jgi:hypothetical protein